MLRFPECDKMQIDDDYDGGRDIVIRAYVYVLTKPYASVGDLSSIKLSQ